MFFFLTLTVNSVNSNQLTEQTYVEQSYIEIIETECEKHNICPELVTALIEKESTGNPNATCKDGCHKGLCQLSEKYFGGEGIDLYDPETNIRIACDYLGSLFDKYEDVSVVLAKYHGESNIYKVSSYTKWILNRSEELERLNEKLNGGEKLATRHKLSGGIECIDDEPVDLDCGCTAEPGDDYTVYTFDVKDKDDKQNIIKFSCCWDSDCIQYNLREILNKYEWVRLVSEEEKHLNTEYEEQMDYQDYLCDRADDLYHESKFD